MALLEQTIAPAIREAIINGALPGGMRLSELQVARRLQVSRTPVRRALNQLAHEGLVMIAPHVGATVRAIRPEDVEEIYEVRIALEVLAVKLLNERLSAVGRAEFMEAMQSLRTAAADADAYAEALDAYHLLIMRLARNRTLVQMYQNLVGPIRRFRRINLGPSDRVQRSLRANLRVARAMLGRRFGRCGADGRTFETSQRRCNHFATRPVRFGEGNRISMTTPAERAVKAVDKGIARDVLTRLVDTPSPTGHEMAIAQLLAEIFREYKLETRLQNIYDDRYNVVGRMPGTGGGPTLLFSGHLDTSVRGDEDYLSGIGWKNKAVIDGDWLYGNGAFNMKNGFASFIAAIAAMRSCDVKLPGDIMVAGTAGEIEMAPVDEFEGREYDGYGTGMWHLVSHGVAADVHVLPEPTGLNVHVGMFGTVWAKITTHGAFAHTAWSASQPSAIKRMRPMIDAIESWAPEYKKAQHVYGSGAGRKRGSDPRRSSVARSAYAELCAVCTSMCEFRRRFFRWMCSSSFAISSPLSQRARNTILTSSSTCRGPVR